MKYSILIYIYFQILVSIQNVLTNNEPQIAFFCGRPANIFKNNEWTLDYQQGCLEDAESIVKYCQNIFPKLNILTAEPAVQNINFKNWCDFNKQNCEVDVEIRPFKCLDKDFLSDALLLPRYCQFGHLFNQSGCLNYKTWVERATTECIKQDDWTIKSYGMLFACGVDNKIIKPMFFKGVEFVCCPKFSPKAYNGEDDVNMYKNYLSNAVLETEQGEQNIYENAEKALIKAKKEKEINVINNFKESEDSLKNLWETNPVKAKERENNFINKFKRDFTEIQNTFLRNKKQLFNYHDERLEFIFNAKLKAAKENLLKKEDTTETEYESMKTVLTIILNRKKYLLAELEEAMTIKDYLADKIYKKIDLADRQINDFFRQINKPSLKIQLLEYLTTTYPDSSKSIKLKNSIYGDRENREKDPMEIIKKYIHQSDEPKYDGNVIIHYDLGLNDLDQLNHYSQDERNRNVIVNHSIKRNDSKTLLGIIFGVLASVVLVLIIGSGFIIYQQKRRTSGYSNPHSKFDDKGKRIYGFGVFNAEKNFKDSCANGYENFTYMATSHLGKSVEVSQMDTSQSNDGDDEQPQIPLIN